MNHAAPQEPPERQHRVLVAEDDTLLANAMAQVLRGAGYEVAVASNRSSAESLLQAFRPAVVTLDLRMPHIGDGLGVLDTLKKNRDASLPRNCKVLIVSGDEFTDTALALAMGANGALNKPVVFPALVAEVNRMQKLFLASEADAS